MRKPAIVKRIIINFHFGDMSIRNMELLNDYLHFNIQIKLTFLCNFN